MRNPNNLLSKNTFSIQKNLKGCKFLLQISATIQISTIQISAIQNLLQISIAIQISTIQISAAIQIFVAIQNSAANKICYMEKILLH